MFKVSKIPLSFSYVNIEKQFYVRLHLITFHIKDDVILRLIYYVHHRKQISAVILKPNSEVTSPHAIFTKRIM